jgi:hypothetical protein
VACTGSLAVSSLYLRHRERSLAVACTGNLAVSSLSVLPRKGSPSAVACTSNLAVSSVCVRLRERSPTPRKINRPMTANDGSCAPPWRKRAFRREKVQLIALRLQVNCENARGFRPGSRKLWANERPPAQPPSLALVGLKLIVSQSRPPNLYCRASNGRVVIVSPPALRVVEARRGGKAGIAQASGPAIRDKRPAALLYRRYAGKVEDERRRTRLRRSGSRRNHYGVCRGMRWAGRRADVAEPGGVTTRWRQTPRRRQCRPHAPPRRPIGALASHVLPNPNFWEAGAVALSAN